MGCLQLWWSRRSDALHPGEVENVIACSIGDEHVKGVFLQIIKILLDLLKWGLFLNKTSVTSLEVHLPVEEELHSVT